MERQTIAEIKQLLLKQQIDASVLQDLRQDTRKGVQQLLRVYDINQEKEQALLQAQEQKCQFDRLYQKEGTLLAGVDEAGRGPLAGPVTAAAVILPDHFSLPGLTDSKQVTEKQRNDFYEKIKKEAIAYHIQVVEPEEIDRVNILEATKMAMSEAIRHLKPAPHTTLIDAVKLDVNHIHTEAILKGDDKSLAIAAASILAKVKRDEIMLELDVAYPAYAFAKNKGYGTSAHLQALQRNGPCPAHRRSFAPVSGM